MRLPALAVLAVVLTACEQRPASSPAAVQEHVALSRAASCEALTQAVQDTAVRQMRSQLESSSGYPLPMAAGAGPAPQASGTPSSYTTTNTQVPGVDESDFVKNDGTRIFVLSGRTLFAATSWPPQDLAVAGKLEIEGWPTTMFLEGDQVVVFSGIWTVPEGTPANADGSAAVPCPSSGCWGLSTTKITVVDVSDLSAPTVVSELYLPGYPAGARRIGESVRLVLGDGVRWPEGFRWWPEVDPAVYHQPELLKAAIARLMDANEAIIRATPLQSWFPPARRKVPGGGTVDVGYRCGDFYLSNVPERLGLVTIATLDLAHLDSGVSRTSIVGEPGVLYATATRLYLASKHWWWWEEAGQRDWTYVHAFAIDDPANATYLASGGVEGHVGNQFAIDERDGYLRIATSTATYTDDPARPSGFRVDVGSRLSVLALRSDETSGAALTLVGEIESLVPGERLMATRFVGDRGYAVTFRNVDPLVTLDLRDPAHPAKVAELTLPGFSTYLEPIDGDHLLAIGEDVPLDAAGRPDWSKRAVQLSLFDVGDLRNPVRTAQALIGTASAYSVAQWDHHAFNWYRPDPSKPGILAIPFSDWIQPTAGSPWGAHFVSDVRFFSVDPGGNISPAGSLSMSDVYLQQGSGEWAFWYQPWVRRSVMATDQGGNTFVYAVSDAGIRSAALSRLDVPLATTLFPR